MVFALCYFKSFSVSLEWFTGNGLFRTRTFAKTIYFNKILKTNLFATWKMISQLFIYTTLLDSYLYMNWIYQGSRVGWNLRRCNSSSDDSVSGWTPVSCHRSCLQLRWRELQYQDWMRSQLFHQTSRFLDILCSLILCQICEQNLLVQPLPWTGHPMWNGLPWSHPFFPWVQIKTSMGSLCPIVCKLYPDSPSRKSSHQDAKLMQKSSPGAPSGC